MKKGLTLIELMITVVMFLILSVLSLYIFRIILFSWFGQERRTGISVVLDRATEEMARELREAADVRSLNSQSLDPNEIRFTVEEDGADAYYVYYFYHEEDSYVPPPAFGQDSYILKRTALSGSITGTFTYGSGKIIIVGVDPPPSSDLSFDDDDNNGIIDADGRITIDLSVTRGDETIRSRTEIRPRNL